MADPEPFKMAAFPLLPFMETWDDALRIVRETRDSFYATAFMLECWLGQITCHTVAEYSEKKQAKDRRLQTGAAKKYFDEMFGGTKDDELQHIVSHLARFGEHDNPQSNIVFKVFGILGADLPWSEAPDPAKLPREEIVCLGAAHMRRVLDRTCEWVEAKVHRDTHVHTWLSPVSFHPDEETREIACVGVLQRNYRHLDAAAQRRWHAHYEDLARRLGESAKWPMMGKAMASDATKAPHHPNVDQVVIMLWPLLRRHDWTYRELMEVVCDILPDARRYPCEREQDLAAYCSNVLGLRKGLTGRSRSRDKIPGREVARTLFASS